MSVDLRAFADPETLSRAAATATAASVSSWSGWQAAGYGNVEKCQFDPHWRDLILFYEK